jgi:transketolase
LPDNIRARLAVEAGVPDYWFQFVGSEGAVIGINTFGASAPEKDVWKAYGFTVDRVKEAVMSINAKSPSEART